MAAMFKVKTGKDGKWYFSLVAPNGEVISQSQGYAQKESAINGINANRRYAPIAEVVFEETAM